MEEHHLTVGRTARYYTLGAAGPATRELWFACHGYGQLAARFLRHFEPVTEPARLIVAPEGLSRFYLSESSGERRVGASWMTREDRLREIDDYLHYLDALYDEVAGGVERSAVRVTALGFSQGAATVSRWAGLGRASIDHVVLWGGELPPDLDLAAARERLRRAHVTLVAGDGDQFITPKVTAAAVARLAEHEIPHTVRTFAGGHELNAAALRALATA